jgi:hypothetical protein
MSFYLCVFEVLNVNSLFVWKESVIDVVRASRPLVRPKTSLRLCVKELEELVGFEKSAFRELSIRCSSGKQIQNPVGEEFLMRNPAVQKRGRPV